MVKNILRKIKHKFLSQTDKMAYIVAMKDIDEYKTSLVSYKVVGLDKLTNKVIEESYVGMTKKLAVKAFNDSHPDVYVTFSKAFGYDEYDKYLDYLRRLDTHSNNSND